MPRSALIVVVPEAEALVAALRLRYDPMAAHGVPAHVTVLFPFDSPIDDATADRIGAICCQHPAFAAEFVAVERFPGLVVWLRPEPSEPFSALTAAVFAEFPEHPPYGGTIAEPIPHLTVADEVNAATASKLQAELDPRLPIRSQIDELTLLVEDEARRWSVARTWQLGAVATP
jgi:2'-5' RNA ligase